MDDVEDTARDDPGRAGPSDEDVEDVSESDDGSEYSSRSEGEFNWYVMSDSILLSIFQYLTPRELLTAGEVCQSWFRVSRDEFLWKYLFYRTYKIDPDVGIVPGKTSWLGEFKRLTYHTPLIETEVLKEHSHQVLHVSFSHNGKMFATCSKDGYILVWQSQYPVTIKYWHDMKTFSWKYTQFSQFNCTDTLLLVSGVHFGTPHSTSGEIAVFRVAPGFDLQCRVVNKPYDIFGTWYSERYLLSGNLHWLAHLVSTSVVWLNKANQESASEHVPIMTQLFRFYNGNASSIRAIMVANCLAPAPAESTEQQSQPSSSNTKEEKGNPPSHKDLLSPSGESNSSQSQEEPIYYISSSRIQYSKLEGAFSNWKKLGDGFEYASPIQYNQEYRQVEMQKKAHESDSESENPQWEEEESESGESSITEECDTDELANNPEKLLIFTTGSKTYTPHKVGFKRIKLVTFPRRLDPGPSLRERIAQQKRERERQNTPSVEDWLNYESVADKFDKIDHLIDLHGHIIGMGLSPDHRYLYVNSRPWPKGYVITNPLQPPPIAQEIDIHVIDLVTLKQVGTMLRAHKAYTPNNECFFIFLDVCNEYVASGAEDKHGYLWDRHYGICLAKFPHSDVVNSVAFNPRDPEMLVTTSDDYTVKIWRSRAMVKALDLDEKSYCRGMEVRKRHKYQKCGTNVD
ncbi:PREDICTED: F-box/WD repeat-containing protein 5 isoform X1 [Trachymyrmex cornetzi]|uniref:F-box/WD repeat-containing protein 5 n=1 Tax=Trachymyrmex cornetzi TaxID=471704 RepID=A0A195DIH5_9HYME|nr:PREDICTED: F-box/WD repeat-containing protein 5 isoform X1 [Trachymyrmex cornetzi]KYN12631.1 F-box/WD repeat-containing protein 5 [Trachymyrmex cornetzi]